MKTVEYRGRKINITDDSLDVYFFRTLDQDEERSFREWADDQPDGTEINPVWHPFVQDQLFKNGKGIERK